MDLLTYNTNIYFFLLTSLAVWFLRVLYAFQLWFFFFFANILVNFSYFSFFKNNPEAGFILIYLLYCIFSTMAVNVCQFGLFFFIWGIKNTNNSYLENISGQGSTINGFSTVSLYLPVLITTPTCNVLLPVQTVINLASIIFLFVFLNCIL